MTIISIDFDGTITEPDSYEDFKNKVWRPQSFQKGFLEYMPKLVKLDEYRFVICTARLKPEDIQNVKDRLKEIDYLKYFYEVTNTKLPASFYFDDRSMPIDWKAFYETVSSTEPFYFAKTYAEKLNKPEEVIHN